MAAPGRAPSEVPRSTRRAERDGARGPVDASQGLLNQILARPVDAGYIEAAVHEGERPRRSVFGRIGIAVIAVVLGLTIVWSVRILRVPLPEAAETRDLLQRELSTRSDEAERQQLANEDLSAQLESLRAAQLPAGAGGAETSTGLGVEAGTVAVTGPGLVVQLDDAKAVRDNPDTADSALRVKDGDLQVVANGLWQAGAEAISINGHRLTSLSAIRSAGDAIQVDLAPILPPYRVEAIGDAGALETGIAQNRAGLRLRYLTDNYDIPVAVSRSDSLALPGAAVTQLRYASPIGR